MKTWNTRAGLGQLASDPSVKPVWHAAAVTWAPSPNLVFLVEYGEDVHEVVAQVAAACRQAGCLS